MNHLPNKKKIFSYTTKLIFINLLLFSNFNSFGIFTKASNIDFPSNSNSRKLFRYLIGPGDVLKVMVFKLSSFNAVVKVLPDGTINLPRLGSIFVNGLNIDEVQQKITDSYKRIIRKPIVYVDLVTTRPIRIAITGEIQKPGIYSINVNDKSQLINSDDGEALNVTLQGWPTLFEAIQKAGGFTIYSDLRDIKLSRKNRLTGEITTTKINLWNSISNNDFFENPYLYDGDVIVVGKINSLDESEIYTIANSAFSPSTMNVNVTGYVVNPGVKKVRTNTRLMQAIYSAGGFERNANKSKIKIVRMQSNGSIYSKNYNPSNIYNILQIFHHHHLLIMQHHYLI